MSLPASKANLIEAWRTLRARLERVRESWDDDAARDFERRYIAPLEARVMQATRGVDQLAELMFAARRDCDDDPS